MLTGETVTFITTFIAAYFFALILGPEDYGVWQTAKVLISYSIVFSFSLPFVMRRDFVMLRAEGRIQESENIANLVFTYELIITPLISASLIFYAIFFINSYLFKIAIITVAIIYLTQFIGGFSNILAKGMNNYKIIKKASLLNGVLLVLSIFFVQLWGIKALFLSTIILSLINSIYYYTNRPFNFKIYWDSQLFKKLLLISFPLYIQDISTTVFESIDRLIIARYLTYAQVGLYSLASIVIVPLRLLIASFSVVLFTHLNEKNGFIKNDRIIEEHSLMPHKILSILVPPLLGIILITLPYFIKLFLPKYLLGVESAQISLLGTFFYLLTAFTANGLFVVGLQKKTAKIYIFIGIAKSILCYLTVYLGFGINGVSFSTLIVYVLLDFIMIKNVFSYLNKGFREFLSFFLKEISPILIISVFLLIYNYWVYPFLILHFFNEAFIAFLGLIYMSLVGLPFLIRGVRILRNKEVNFN